VVCRELRQTGRCTSRRGHPGVPLGHKKCVGVGWSHCGELGKKADCQCAGSVHYVGPKGYCPLILRLDPPGNWLADAKRLDRTSLNHVHRPTARLEGDAGIAGECPGPDATNRLPDGPLARKLGFEPARIPAPKTLV
jgi:hypothetical protein